MGKRGTIAKYTQLVRKKIPCLFKVDGADETTSGPVFINDWEKLEKLHGEKIVVHQRDYINNACDFYFSRKDSIKTPKKQITAYIKALESAKKRLTDLSPYFYELFQLETLETLIQQASLQNNMPTDESMLPDQFLIWQIFKVLKYDLSNIPKTTLSENSVNLPPQYQLIQVTFDQAGIHYHSEAALAKWICRNLSDPLFVNK